MRVVVTGSSGGIGSAVATSLAHRGDEVVGLSLRAANVNRVASAAFTRVVGDACDRYLVRSAMRGADAVVHLEHPGTGSG